MVNAPDDSQNIFKILLATDIHLGFQEKDAERGEDTFNSFEEILQLAVTENVDFILLGGDLFHENKPSRKSILRCMELLKKYTYGDKEVNFNFVSDPSVNFPHLKQPTVNYLDPNLNISIPVFSIHGNHDDPSGLGQHSPLEMLSTTGLINYFGRADNLNEINIYPLLLEKGQAKLALYGLSSVKDERLHRLFRENKVRMFRPKEDIESWFNILVLHQNHQKHSFTNYIPEEFLDTFLDLVFWGHEHECLIRPRKSFFDGYFITQPGSSVATSLSAGESEPKHVGILEINSQKKMRLTPHLLKTVRPFVFKDLILSECDLPSRVTNKQSNPVEEIVENHVHDMIRQSKQLLSGHPQQPTKPLIRLRVEYRDESQMFNVNRFGFKFTETVANPGSIVLFRKFREATTKMETDFGVNEEAMDAVFKNDDVSQTKVEDLVEQYFEGLEDETRKLLLLSERGLAHAVSQFVEKDYNDAINLIFVNQVNKTADHLKNLKGLDIDAIEDAIETYHEERKSNKVKDEEEALAAFEQAYKSDGVRNNGNQDDSFDNDQEIFAGSRPLVSRGNRSRGRARGQRSRGGTTRASASNIDDQEEICINEEKPTRGSRGGRQGRRARGSTSVVASTARTPSILEAFSRSSSKMSYSQRKKGISFIADSDED